MNAKLKCNRCQMAPQRARRESHFNVEVLRVIGEGVECRCRNCGHTYISRAAAAYRRTTSYTAGIAGDLLKGKIHES